MPQGLNGLTDASINSMIFDAGAVYFNINLTALEDGVANTTFDAAVAAAIASAIPVGATRGGNSWTRGLTLRQVEADGQLGDTKGMHRRQTVRPALSVTLLEQTLGNIKRQFPGAVDAAAGVWRKITGGPIVSADYITNVALVTTYGSEGKYIVLVVKNALVMESPEFGTEHNNEVATSVTFVGCFSSATNQEEPWAVYLPPAA